eukprot:6492607-Amphidinium_carterae.4
MNPSVSRSILSKAEVTNHKQQRKVIKIFEHVLGSLYLQSLPSCSRLIQIPDQSALKAQAMNSLSQALHPLIERLILKACVQ